MNKILLSSICAVALTSAASAFTLDLSSLNGQNLGVATITNTYGSFQVIGSDAPHVSGGVATLDNAQAFTVIYPSNVSYIGAFTVGNITVTDNGSSVQYASAENGANVSQVTFEVVPEPSSTALLGLGGMALILRRRK